MTFKFRKYENDINFDIHLKFNHGLGDCVHLITLLELYRRRGYRVAVEYVEDKQSLFKLAKIPFCNDGIEHPWLYYAGFNNPRPVEEAYSNKIGMLLNKYPVPLVGITWEELCDAHKPFKINIKEKYLDAAKKFIDDLPRPIILLHSQGDSSKDMKNLESAEVIRLYEKLLEIGSVIELDWHGRCPNFCYGNFRNLKRDWGPVPLDYFFALLSSADIIIGVDSGPLHLARWFPIKKIYIGLQFYFGSVALPAPEQLCIAKAEDRYLNVPRRKIWNVYEYANDKPSANEVCLAVKRMLETKYVESPAHDAMLQQMVFDFCSSQYSDSWFLNRSNTYDAILKLKPKRILETGCIKGFEDWGTGYSTYIFDLAGAEVTTVDIDKERLKLAQGIAPGIKCVCSDSVAFLKQNKEIFDVTYLDSSDICFPDHCLEEAKLCTSPVIAIDDTVWEGGWVGNGQKAVPYLISNGYKIVSVGYGVVLQKL